ncbi:MAG: hypothetical protein ACTHLL_03630 [Candidatus Nitrosocosmicus sp.]
MDSINPKKKIFYFKESKNNGIKLSAIVVTDSPSDINYMTGLIICRKENCILKIPRHSYGLEE